MCEFSASVNAKEHFGAYIGRNKKTYTDSSAPWFDMSLISRYGKKQADELKKVNSKTYPNLLCQMLDISCNAPSLVLGEKERNFSRQFSQVHSLKGRPIVGLNTGAGGRWKFKKLSENKTIEIGDSVRVIGFDQGRKRNRVYARGRILVIWRSPDNSFR